MKKVDFIKELSDIKSNVQWRTSHIAEWLENDAFLQKMRELAPKGVDVKLHLNLDITTDNFERCTLNVVVKDEFGESSFVVFEFLSDPDVAKKLECSEQGLIKAFNEAVEELG